MDEFELTTTDDLVRRYAPDLIPRTTETRLTAHTVAGLTSVISARLLVDAFKPGGSLVLMVLSTCIVGGAAVAEVVTRRSYRTQLGRFYRELAASPWKLYEAVARNFAVEIERQRARTLGPDSDWGRARRPLEAAAQETARSVAYWEQRCATDPGNDVAQQQRETAVRLRDKFQEAVTQLDARAQALVTFFNECEARLAVLQYARRDYEEIRKLSHLSERADDIVTDARTTLTAIGSRFVSEAIRVGNALGGIERVGWLSLADNVAVDRIETLADRILESSNNEREMLDRLAKEVLP